MTGDLNHKATQPTVSSRIWGAVIAGIYVAIVVAAGIFAQPLDSHWLTGIALLPAAAFFAAGLPRVIYGRPRALLALFHLIVYPLAAAVTLGIPAALVAYKISALLDA
jgi:hypothetical protein